MVRHRISRGNGIRCGTRHPNQNTNRVEIVVEVYLQVDADVSEKHAVSHLQGLL
jgi:hypothetical protein